MIMETIWTEMYDAAKAVLNERRISEYVTCGEVAAAIRSKSEKYIRGFVSILVQRWAFVQKEMLFLI